MGKLEGVLLAERLGVPMDALRWSVADNVAACLGATGDRPSKSSCIDAIRLACAKRVGPGTGEGNIPAQHNTGWVGCAADAQATCDVVAKEGASMGIC